MSTLRWSQQRKTKNVVSKFNCNQFLLIQLYFCFLWKLASQTVVGLCFEYIFTFIYGGWHPKRWSGLVKIIDWIIYEIVVLLRVREKGK